MSTTNKPPDAATGHKRPAPRGTASYPRKRAVTACQVCRARRTKCDNAKPACSFCVKVGATCVQTPVDLSSFDPASLQILNRLDDLEQLFRDNATGHAAFVSAPPAERLDRSQLFPCSIESVLDLESLRSLRDDHHPITPAFPCTSRDASQPSTSPPRSILDEFEPHRIRVLLDNFFNFVHVKNPVLDEHHIRRTVNMVCLHGVDWSAESCLSLLICALGTLATPLSGGYVQRGSEAYLTAESFFLAARKRLGLILGTSNVIEAQCMFLAGVYSMCIFDRMPAWRYFMQSLACCQTFDSLTAFRQDYGNELDEAGRRQAAAEQAIYWSAWKSEREVNDTLNLPGFLFSEIDIAGYPPFFPTPPTHDGGTSGLFSDDTETRVQTSWYFYLSEISLLRLWRRMSKDIMDHELEPGQSHLNALAHAVADREAQIFSWIQALPATMSMNDPPEQDEVCQFVLRGHLIDVWEILYWPFVDWCMRSKSDTENEDLIKTLAQKGLKFHVDRIKVNRPGFSHRHHGTFGMIISCTRSALILIAAAAPASWRTEEFQDMPQGWEEAVQEVIQLLEIWRIESADLSKIATTLANLYRNWRLAQDGPLSTTI